MLVKFVSYLYLRSNHIYACARFAHNFRIERILRVQHIMCCMCACCVNMCTYIPLPTVLCVSTCLSTGISEVYVLLSTDVTNRNAANLFHHKTIFSIIKLVILCTGSFRGCVDHSAALEWLYP